MHNLKKTLFVKILFYLLFLLSFGKNLQGAIFISSFVGGGVGVFKQEENTTSAAVKAVPFSIYIEKLFSLGTNFAFTTGLSTHSTNIFFKINNTNYVGAMQMQSIPLGIVYRFSNNFLWEIIADYVYSTKFTTKSTLSQKINDHNLKNSIVVSYVSKQSAVFKFNFIIDTATKGFRPRERLRYGFCFDMYQALFEKSETSIMTNNSLISMDKEYDSQSKSLLTLTGLSLYTSYAF